MKNIESRDIIFEKITSSLTLFDTIEDTLNKLKAAFDLIYQEEPLIKPCTFRLTKTNKLPYFDRNCFWPNSMSQLAIEISDPSCCEHALQHLWRDGDEWNFAEEYNTPATIAREICNAPIFTNIPECVHDLDYLLVCNAWTFILERMPTFDGNPPKDQLEVISWDKKFVLVGTQIENIEVLSREEWSNILSRETAWLR